MTPNQNAKARTAWGEARGLGEDGMRAVMCVITNRVKAQKWWGLTPYEVCHKPYQFSCWLPDDPNLPKLLSVTEDDLQFAIACQLAEDSDQWNWVDITNGATSYYSTTIPTPSWAIGKSPCYTIGNMLFYNNIT
jgi:N-acetylmuramoyl-L-alanine amidase